jgi:hypothetical protein
MAGSESRDEFIFKRCEEIIRDDSESQRLNKEILAQESAFKGMLNPMQLKAYNGLEEKVIAQAAYNEHCVYRQAQKDRY